MKHFFCIIFILSVPALVCGAPNITNAPSELYNGQTYTITGTDLGNHSLDIASTESEIESQPVGPVSDWGNWAFEQAGSQIDPEIVTSQSHSGAKSIYVNIPTMNGSMHRYMHPDRIGYNKDVFVSWWTRRHRTGTHSYQWKLFRVGYSPNSYIDSYTPQFKWFEHNGSYDQFFINPGPGTSPANGGPPYPEDYLQTSFPDQDDRWYRIDIYMHTSSSQGAADGYYSHTVYDPLGSIVESHSSSNWVTFNTGANDYYKYFFWQNWMETSTMSHEIWFDDHYIQVGTQARVELCNSPSWAARTSCDIQVPISWNSNLIAIRANQGSFGVGQTAYLYTIDGEGNVSNNGQGVEVNIGSGTVSIPPPSPESDLPPNVAITAPTTGSSYSIEIAGEWTEVIVSGTSSDDHLVQSVTYATDNNQNGDATSTDSFQTWNIPIGVNRDEVIVTTVTVTDNAGQSSRKQLTITGTSPVNAGTTSIVWDANEQTGDTTLSNSSVTYCVRLLVQGSSINGTGDQVRLGFQGRTTGDYVISNISIAERDTNGNEGDVINETWTQATFGGSAWNSPVTVTAGTEKLSDPMRFNLKAGSDYYVTFKINTPSVYLDPPSGYRELYFPNEDHTRDIDWSANGHSVTQDFHALSNIYIDNSNSPLPPAVFKLNQ